MVKKTAYLTIDDCPSQNMIDKISYLESKSIPAVLFCQGNLLLQRVEQAVTAIRKGFIIGNHSYDHPRFSDLEIDQCYDQIERADKIIDGIYLKAGMKRTARYFRFPHGDKGGEQKPLIQDCLRKLGYRKPKFENITYAYHRSKNLVNDIDWGWTYDVREWEILAEPHLYANDVLENIFARMEENAPEKRKGLNYPYSEEIILVHDHPESDDLFIPIIERLLSKGLEFKPAGP